MLDVVVHRGRRGGRRDKEVAGSTPHAAFPVAHKLVYLIEAFVDELSVFGYLVNVSKRYANSVLLNVANGLRWAADADIHIPDSPVGQRKSGALTPH